MRLTSFQGLIFLFTLFSAHSLAQVSGLITNSKTGKPISGVEIFINKTTISTRSDETGRFAFESVVPGLQEIVLFKKGYILYRSPMKIQAERLYDLKLSLTPSKKDKSYRLAEKELIQLSHRLREQTTTDSITFVNAEVEAMPLVLQNNLTGYQLNYYLWGQSLETVSQAPVWFESLLSKNVQQSIVWEQSRKKYFKGSLRHWLMSVTGNRLREEGYVIRDLSGREIEGQSLLSTSTLQGYSKLIIDKSLVVSYKGENDEEKSSQVSTNGSLDVSVKGVMINAKALNIQGDMARISIADQLPIDYEPIVGNIEEAYRQTIERFYEKVYVHTDKPYYCPGEPMWFKGYINYKEPLWRDSLSKVMYVELINPKNELTMSKVLRIDSGFFHNDFILPDSLQEGTYYLRAYTNLNRNFGDSLLFGKPIPILNITDKVIYTQGKMDSVICPEVQITSDKKIYKPREEIILTVQTRDKEGKTLAANLSLSVTDAIQVVPIEESITIKNSYAFEGNPKNKVLELKCPVEYGVGFKGRFLNNKGKPEKTLLDIFQLKERRIMFAVTDEHGFFRQGGLNFYDSATFSFKAEKAKDYPYGKVELLPREIPVADLKESHQTIAIENTQSPQRIISTYEVPREAKILKEVVIKASKMEVERPKRSYGYADLVVKSKDINQTNVLYTLAHLPGVYVDIMNSTVVFTRAAGQSMFFGKGPLVTIDDIPIDGESAGVILSSINPANIESIEVTKRLNPLYGSQGAGGVIAVYMKKGIEGGIGDVAPNFQLITVPGYSRERKFLYPDYRDPQTDKGLADYRSTIYWNPNIGVTGEKSLSFFAADLPGKYRMVVEGVLQNGEPVRSVSFIAVKSDN